MVILTCNIFLYQVEEFVALTDPKLSLFTGEEDNIDSYDERPQHKITQFRYLIRRPFILDLQAFYV